jgi:lipoprotein-anchoring transpeptidase ErfK/SrfK
MNGLRQLAAVTACVMGAMTVALNVQDRHPALPNVASLWSGMAASAAPLASSMATNPPAAKPAVAAKPVVAKPLPVAVVSPPIPDPEGGATPAVPYRMQPPPIDAAVLAEQSGDVAQHLRDRIPAALFPYFDEFLYVSKAAGGAWAQHLYMFHKSASGELVYEQAFPVSTGREQQEKYFTSTPTGMFELDPNRFDRVHFSHRWHGAAMPWAMFLDYTIHGHATGIAMHSAETHAYELGKRASGGCVRLPPEKAEELFKRFQAEERGLVPVFAFDDSRATTFTDGSMVRDASGNVELQDGYRVLLFIEDYPGGPAVVAVLS